MSGLTEACTGYRRYPVRESRYPMLLRGKHATGGTDSKTEKASIGELRRSLIDTLTKERHPHAGRAWRRCGAAIAQAPASSTSPPTPISRVGSRVAVGTSRAAKPRTASNGKSSTKPASMSATNRPRRQVSGSARITSTPSPTIRVTIVAAVRCWVRGRSCARASQKAAKAEMATAIPAGMVKRRTRPTNPAT